MRWFLCSGLSDSKEEKEKKKKRMNSQRKQPDHSHPISPFSDKSMSGSSSNVKGSSSSRGSVHKSVSGSSSNGRWSSSSRGSVHKSLSGSSSNVRGSSSIGSSVQSIWGSSSSIKGNPSSVGSVDNCIAVRTFSFRDLVTATQNFRGDCLLGEGGFGRVYKGSLDNNQVVAIKQLNLNGLQGNREFLVEVLVLSLLHHPNLVNLIGYCADGDQRLLVYEYMPLGSLEDHLHGISPGKRQLNWDTRMKIAVGAAKGVEYLHDKASPPVIYRDLKCSNILLDERYHPKLSDFGLAKLGPTGDNSHVSTRVMGTYGYCAPEYAMTGQLTPKSDVYSFGVVLLEIISGRRAIENSKMTEEQNLVAWARPLFSDRKKFMQIADPRLQGQYPRRGLYQALAVARMCVEERPDLRPAITDVVTALSYLASQNYEPDHSRADKNALLAPCTPPRVKWDGNNKLSSTKNSSGRETTKKSC